MPGEPDEPGRGRDVDDGAAAARPHRCDGGARAEERAAEVDRQQSLELAPVLFLDRAHPVDRRIVDEDVEAAEPFRGRRHHALPVLLVRHVVREEQGVLTDVGGHRLPAFPQHVGQDDGRAFACEQARLRLALPLRRAGDDRDLALETSWHPDTVTGNVLVGPGRAPSDAAAPTAALRGSLSGDCADQRP